jgi:hypothetical protein
MLRPSMVSSSCPSPQLELPLPSHDVVACGDVLAEARLLHRQRVESLNEAICERGEEKVRPGRVRARSRPGGAAVQGAASAAARGWA